MTQSSNADGRLSQTRASTIALTNFAAEMEREKARQHTYDAMLRKTKALHVTGGKVFGHDNVEVNSGALLAWMASLHT